MQRQEGVECWGSRGLGCLFLQLKRGHCPRPTLFQVVLTGLEKAENGKGAGLQKGGREASPQSGQGYTLACLHALGTQGFRGFRP